MRKHMEDLYILQGIEAKAAQIETAALESDEAKRNERCRQLVAACLRETEKIDQNFATTRRTLRAYEDELARVQRDIDAIEGKLFGGTVTNPKELAGLHERLESGKRQRSDLEEKVLEAMDAFEITERKVKKAKTELDAAERAAGQAQKALGDAQVGWDVEIRRLQDERTAIRARVDATPLRVYDATKARFGGRPVAKIENRTCSGCRVGLPTGARPLETTQCPNCGRLVWWAE